MLDTNVVFIVITVGLVLVVLFSKSFRKNVSSDGFFRNPERDVPYIDFSNGVAKLENKYNLEKLEIKSSPTLSGYKSFCGFEK